MSKRAFFAEYKFEILKVYEEGNHSINEITSTYKVDSSNIMEWKHRFEKYGVVGLQNSLRGFSFWYLKLILKKISLKQDANKIKG